MEGARNLTECSTLDESFDFCLERINEAANNRPPNAEFASGLTYLDLLGILAAIRDDFEEMKILIQRNASERQEELREYAEFEKREGQWLLDQINKSPLCCFRDGCLARSNSTNTF